MSFLWPPMLLALALVPLGVGIYLAIDRRRQARVASLGAMGLAPSPRDPRRRFLGRFPPLLFLLGLTVLLVALARPQAAFSLPRPEGTLILTFDVSGSMSAADVEPSRLEVGREVARRFVDERPEGVVIGVVAFSDAGLAVQAPTVDEVTLDRALDRLEPTLGTSVGDGILASLEVVASIEAGTPAEYYSDRTPEPSASPIPLEPGSHTTAAIVLLSDGENTIAPDPAEAAERAAASGIRIHTVGLGTVSGTTLELEDFIVHTQLDEAALRHVADVTAGEYLELDPEAETIADTIDPETVYASLGRQLVVRPEPTEVTSLVAGAGLVLLVCGAALSLVTQGRLI
jgi:Ca-activated chloride channel family protein